MPEWTKKYKKAVTFSYDDGNEQDIRLVEIFNRYGMKCTFNLNSGLNAENGSWVYMDKIKVNRLNLSESKEIYAGHEIAVHTSTHPDLTKCLEEDAWKEISEDADRLTEIFGKRPVGMAHPYGTYSDMVGKLMERTGLRYGRGVWESLDFSVPVDLKNFRPTCHHDQEQIFSLIDRFLMEETQTPRLLYIWGHSYEFEGKENWDHIERICEKLAGNKELFYGTNQEVLL